MFSNIVESALRQAGAGLLTEAFIFIMFAVFMIALLLNYFGAWKSFTSYTATLLTSLGILGTFAGVVTGLLDFDSSVEKIDSSIGSLLQGLKTAFISSLVGMTLSILYKVLILVPWLSRSSSGQPENGVTIESLYEIEQEQSHYLHAIATAMAGNEGASVLRQLRTVCESLENMQQQIDSVTEEQKTSNQNQLHILERTLQTLSDDGESSLTGQLKLVRTDANDVGKHITAGLERVSIVATNQLKFHEEWRPEQRQIMESSFAQLNSLRSDAKTHAAEADVKRSTIVELLERSPTETLIAALEDVIRDFNKHISEQFGENFKELNVAVGRMVEWQENYRSQIEQLQESFDSSAESIGKCEESMISISDSSRTIPDNMEMLADVLKVSHFQLNELQSHLQAFADVKQHAVESVPALHEIVEDVAKKVEKSTAHMLDSYEKGSLNFIEGLDVAVTSLSQSSSETQMQLSAVAKSTSHELQIMLNGLRGSIEQQFEQTNTRISELINKEFENMEKVRSEQIERNLVEMGTALASITGQFARDYSDLVNAMKVIVDKGHRHGG